MRVKSIYSNIRAVTIALILGFVFIAQSFSLAHAIEHLDHEQHECVMCDIPLIAGEETVVLPDPLHVPSFTPSVELAPDMVFTSATYTCLLYTSPSPRDGLLSRMPSSA